MKKNLLILFCITLCINKTFSQTNWELLNPKPTANTGKDVEFVTNNIGYIITSNELLETLDAGNTWLKKQNIFSGNDMSFYSTTGYIVGNSGYVLKSVDNGTSWNPISTGFYDNFNTVNIIDNNNIILSTSNTIVKTNDGGTTWESLSIPEVTVNKTFFTSSLIGHAVCTNGTILKTIDGGQNWYTTQSTNAVPSDFFTVYFINENVGLATREHNEMFKTTDAGETWVVISGTGGGVMYDFHFLDENNGFATGADGATYKTTDGGNTWNSILFQNGYYANTSMYGIYFQDSNNGYATGERGRIIKTTDGGATWTPNSITYNNFKQLQFVNDNVGYALSDSYFYKTSDAGNTWALVGSLSLGTSVTSSVFTFVNENLGYATTGGPYGGKVFKTIDGGVTWTALNNGYDIIDEGITSIFFLDENNGFISGGYNQRKVMKTTNGGSTWTQVESMAFGQIQFINNQIGYAHTIGYSNGRMYKTTDGGNTWAISIEVDGAITAFHFVDENTGYFVGSQGLIHRTFNGGSNWEEIDIQYGWYTEVNFYSKNVGYIADEEGRLYKTINGGISWNYLTQQNKINSIELVNNKIYTAGSNGKIHRSDVAYNTIDLQVNPAHNISNNNAILTGSVASNGDAISNIQFEYSLDNSFTNIISTTPSTVDANESLSFSVDILNLDSNTTYYYRLSGAQNSNTSYSQTLSFTTLPDYEITTNNTFNFSSTTAEISGNIVSNGYDITNVEFQYGTNTNVLDSALSGTPTTVLGNTTENSTASLINLESGTQYFYRIKATHQGDEIYGDIRSFTTNPEYNINLNGPYITGTDVTLSANIASYNQDITDIRFEYGTLNFENSILTNPSQVNANSSSLVMTTISNLDTNLNYYFRLKANHNGEEIYSEEGVFNFSGEIIMLIGTIEEPQNNSLELRGLINCYGAFLTNIQFEYGVTQDFGSSISGTPNIAYGIYTNLITGLINNLLSNQTYYYRLVATDYSNGNVIYSDTYQYTTGLLSLSNFDHEKGISIYPNPATDFVFIKSNISEKVKSIEFYNALGQRIYNENVFNISDIKVNVSNFSKGLYFIKVNFENLKTISSKLILN